MRKFSSVTNFFCFQLSQFSHTAGLTFDMLVLPGDKPMFGLISDVCAGRDVPPGSLKRLPLLSSTCDIENVTIFDLVAPAGVKRRLNGELSQLEYVAAYAWKRSRRELTDNLTVRGHDCALRRTLLHAACRSP